MQKRKLSTRRICDKVNFVVFIPTLLYKGDNKHGENLRGKN